MVWSALVEVCMTLIVCNKLFVMPITIAPRVIRTSCIGLEH